MWNQDNIYLEESRLVGPFKFGILGKNKLKYPNMIEYKQWKELEEEGIKMGMNTSDDKEVVPMGW